MIQFTCSSCQASYRVSDEHQGAKTVCRRCRQPLQVPAPAAFESSNAGVSPAPGAIASSLPGNERWKAAARAVLVEAGRIPAATCSAASRLIVRGASLYRLRQFRLRAAACQRHLGEELYQAQLGDASLRQEIAQLEVPEAKPGRQTQRVRAALLLRLGESEVPQPAPAAVAHAWQQTQEARAAVANHLDLLSRASPWPAPGPERRRAIAGGALAVGLLLACGWLMRTPTASPNRGVVANASHPTSRETYPKAQPEGSGRAVPRPQGTFAEKLKPAPTDVSLAEKEKPAPSKDNPAKPEPKVNPESPGQGPGTVFLQKADQPTDFRVGLWYGVLAREMVRQAAWLAAQDEFGLTTRDGALREPLPEGLSERQQLYVGAFFESKKPFRFTISRGAQRNLLGSGEFVLPVAPASPIDYVKLLERAEILSRKEFVEALRKAGFRGKANRRSEAKVPDSVEKLLGQLTFTAQYAAVRELHGLIRSQGESPALRGALVRSYANLGILTEYHWYASYKIFWARALLSAQRLVAADSQSASALWHRSYALALAGLHRAALADLAAAERLPGAKGPRPAWVGLIDAYCRFDQQALAKAAPRQPLDQLGTLLRYLAIENYACPALTIETGQNLLRTNSECFRVHDTLSNAGGVSTMHVTTLAGPRILSSTLPGRLQAMAGLPEPVRALLRKQAPEPQVVAALIAAPADATEPSWNALGHLIREVRYTQTLRRLHFMRFQWNVPVDDYLKEALPAIAGHPYEAMARTFGIDPGRDRQAYTEMVQRIPIVDLSFNQFYLLGAYTPVDEKRSLQVLNQTNRFTDSIYRDYAAILPYLDADVDTKTRNAGNVYQISPHAPLAHTILIEDAWPHAQKLAPEWVKDCQHPTVLRAIGSKYLAMGRTDDAERCLKQSLALSADLATYRKLADVYKAQGKTALWLQTLEEFLKQPDPGLDHARVRVDIAHYYMMKNEYQKAQPYAEAAAQTWAAWAMFCAADCYAGLGDAAKGEMWIQRVSERYDDWRFAWYFWCLRSGKGDIRAARQLAEQKIRLLGDKLSADDRANLAVFYLTAKRPDKATELFEAGYRQNPAESLALFLISLYDEQGKTQQRDRMIKELAGHNTYYGRLAGVYRDALANGEKGLPDLKAVENVLRALKPHQAADACYFVGSFLQRRGDVKNGLRYLDRCATAIEAHTMQIRALAAFAMRETGQEPGKVQR